MINPAIQLSVVMPLYNEGSRIAASVEQTLGVLRMLGPFEIIWSTMAAPTTRARRSRGWRSDFPTR